MKADIEKRHLQTKEYQWFLATSRSQKKAKKDTVLETSEKMAISTILFWTSRSQNYETTNIFFFLLFKATQFVVHYGIPSILIQIF